MADTEPCNEYCENYLCERPAVKDVLVSVMSAGDEVRSLCAPCEEAYAWGVQHGTSLVSAAVKQALPPEGR